MYFYSELLVCGHCCVGERFGHLASCYRYIICSTSSLLQAPAKVDEVDVQEVEEPQEPGEEQEVEKEDLQVSQMMLGFTD